MSVRQVRMSVIAIVLGFCAVCSRGAEAGVVVSNLANAGIGAWTLGSGTDLVDSPVANQFTTGSGPGWSLNSVTLSLGLFSGTPTGSISVSIAADSGGVPGTTLASFPVATPTSPVENITLAPLTGLVLASNTSYWVVATAVVGDNYVWNFTDDTSETGLAGWSIGNTSYWNDGTGWTALGFPVDEPAPTLFEVNATAVPEPSTLLMAGIGLAVAALYRPRRSK